MGRALSWLLVSGALAGGASLLGGCEDEAAPAPLGTGAGGGSGTTVGSGAGPAQDPNAANAACVAQMGEMMGIDWSEPGDTIYAWAFDHMVGSVVSACGRLGGNLEIRPRFIVDNDGVVLHALRLRPGGWEVPADGTWLELMPPTPVPISNDNPLPATVEGWTVSVISRTEDMGGAGGAGGDDGGMGGNAQPHALGWLFDQMESSSVTLGFEPPLTGDALLNGAEVTIHFTINGGDYLRVDQESDERVLMSEPGAVAQGCVRGGLNALTETEDLRETPCGPSFDSCAGGTQVCNLTPSHTIMMCAPLDDCEGTCPFSCAGIGSGSCGD